MPETTYSKSFHQVFREQNALELNHEEVDELFDITEHIFERLAWDRQVFPWAERAHDALVDGKLAKQLSGRDNCSND